MERLMKLLQEVREDIDFDTTEGLIDEGYLESLDIIQIIALIEEEFDISLSVADITPNNFNSAQSIWNLVCQSRK